jgi:hypothetical protein
MFAEQGIVDFNWTVTPIKSGNQGTNNEVYILEEVELDFSQLRAYPPGPRRLNLSKTWSTHSVGEVPKSAMIMLAIYVTCSV